MLSVLLIISLLITVVVGLYWHAQEATHRRRALADLGLLQHTLERFYLDFGQYPDFGSSDPVSVTNLLNLPASALVSPSPVPESWFEDRLPPEFTALDPWGGPYQYAHDSGADGQDVYRLYSRGPDGQDASDDDIYFQP